MFTRHFIFFDADLIPELSVSTNTKLIPHQGAEQTNKHIIAINFEQLCTTNLAWMLCYGCAESFTCCQPFIDI